MLAADAFAPGVEQAGIDCRNPDLPCATRPGTAGQQACGEGQPGIQRIAVEQAIDYPAALRLGGIDRRAGDDHLQRLFHTGQARQALRAAGTWQQSEPYLRQTDAGVTLCDAVVAGQRHFQSTAQRRAMQHGQRRLGRALDGQGQLRQDRRLRRLAELADIGAGDEGLAGAIQHDQFHPRIGSRLGEGIQQAGTHGMTEGVDRRVVDADQGDAPLARQLYGRSHRWVHSGWRFWMKACMPSFWSALAKLACSSRRSKRTPSARLVSKARLTASLFSFTATAE
ncbi:hypothetical protein D3C81_1091930 [compost metagenome]